jgi:hypothetical protein
MSLESFPHVPAACPYCGDVQPLPIIPPKSIIVMHCDKCKGSILPIMGQAVKFDVNVIVNKPEEQQRMLIKEFVKEYIYDIMDHSLKQGQVMLHHMMSEMKKVMGMQFGATPGTTHGSQRSAPSISNKDIKDIKTLLENSKDVNDFLNKLG